MDFILNKATEFLIYFFQLCSTVNIAKSMSEEDNRYRYSAHRHRNLKKYK